jgi:thioredoxin 1
MVDNLKILDNNSNFEEILSNNKIVIVDFFADWCGPCQMFSKILEDFAKENQDIFCIKINVDNFSNISQKYNIRSLPTILVFKNKDLISSNVGLIPKGMLLDLVLKLK